MCFSDCIILKDVFVKSVLTVCFWFFRHKQKQSTKSCKSQEGRFPKEVKTLCNVAFSKGMLLQPLKS